MLDSLCAKMLVVFGMRVSSKRDGVLSRYGCWCCVFLTELIIGTTPLAVPIRSPRTLVPRASSSSGYSLHVRFLNVPQDGLL